MKTKELKELLERATKSSDPWASRVAFDKLRDNLLDNTAELIRCRELLAGYFAEMEISDEGQRRIDLWESEAKKYLSETEG